MVDNNSVHADYNWNLKCGYYGYNAVSMGSFM